MHTLAQKGALTAMTMRESWTSYVRRITAGRDRKDVAAAAGINVSGLSRWLTGTSRPSPEKVIDFARGLRQSPIEALVAAGYLDDADIGGVVEIMQSLAALSDDALMDELYGRLRRRAADQSETGSARLDRHSSREGMRVEQSDDRGKERG